MGSFSHLVDVDGMIANVFNTMFDTLYSLISPERQYIFPIFWIKVSVWFLIGILPTILTIIEVIRMGRYGVILFMSGIAIGALIVFYV